MNWAPSHLPGWVLWACFVWTSPLPSAGWWSGRWGCCSGRGPALLNGACGGSPGVEWSRWCPGPLGANTAWSETDCDCHNLEQSYLEGKGKKRFKILTGKMAKGKHNEKEGVWYKVRKMKDNGRLLSPHLAGWLGPWSASLWRRLHTAGPESGGEDTHRSRELK